MLIFLHEMILPQELLLYASRWLAELFFPSSLSPFVFWNFRAIKRSNCFHKSAAKDPCHMSSNGYMITFGIAEILLSQIPDFDQVWWLSIVAAIMSFTYSTAGLGLGIGKVAGKQHGDITI